MKKSLEKMIVIDSKFSVLQELERRKKFQDLYSKTSKQKIPAFGSPDAEVNREEN